jgi:hypothetical protein
MPVTENQKSSFPWPTAVVVLCAMVAVLIVSLVNPEIIESRLHPGGPRKQEINCVNNLKHIGLAFRQWALDNGDRFPFNVATNEGGTWEWCALDGEGFDASAFRHFQVLSNELNTPVILVCPNDKTRKPARDFAGLLAENVTYRVHSGTNVTDTHPTEILVLCPVDGNTLYCDGSVKEGKRK